MFIKQLTIGWSLWQIANMWGHSGSFNVFRGRWIIIIFHCNCDNLSFPFLIRKNRKIWQPCFLVYVVSGEYNMFEEVMLQVIDHRLTKNSITGNSLIGLFRKDIRPISLIPTVICPMFSLVPFPNGNSLVIVCHTNIQTLICRWTKIIENKKRI